MKLPFNLFNNNKDEESEYYLALLITDEKISAVILQQTLGKLRIVGKNEEFYLGNLETIDPEELINLIDKTISSAEEILPPNIETHKTVFGVKDTWVEPDTKKIKKDYLTRLKKVCDTLDLSPIGFMVINEAIANLLQDEEGAPLSAILAEIGKKRVMLTLFRGGKAAESIDGPIEESAPQTVDKLLKHFTTAVLPARIIMYDSKNTEKLAQEFISHQWSKSLPFLHVPQITPLPEGTDARAVVFGAATQMGFEVLGMDVVKEPVMPKKNVEEKEKTKHEQKEVTEEESAEENTAIEKDEESEETKEDKKHRDEEKRSETLTADNFGFVSDQDISDFKKKTDVEEVHATHHVHLNQEDPSASLRSNSDPEQSRMGSGQDDAKEKEERGEKTNLLAPIFAMIKGLKLPRMPFTNIHGNKRFIFPLAILAALIVVGFGLFLFYTNNVQATIVLTVQPKEVNETEDVTFSPTSASDFSKNVISTKAIETTVNGNLTIDTTGKKDVGNKAKGTVTIYNNGSSSVKLESGSAIKSSNGLTFLLDKDITVASASGDIFSGTKPGTGDVAVTAKDIGTDSNLPSGTKFAVGSNTSLAGKNDSAFSGGSKKQVQVVSKNDIAKLRAELPKSLEGKANTEISQKTSDDEALIPIIQIINLDNQKFDKELDDEAKKVKLTANVKFAGQTYKKAEIIDFAKSLLKSKYSQDLAFAEESVTANVTDAEEGKDDEIAATLELKAGLLPSINKDELIKNVQNKSVSETKALLSQQPQVVNTQITYSPNTFILPIIFSHLPKQVTIEVKPE